MNKRNNRNGHFMYNEALFIRRKRLVFDPVLHLLCFVFTLFMSGMCQSPVTDAGVMFLLVSLLL